MKRLLILFTVAVAFIFCATVSSDEAKEDKGATHEYVGVKKCKMCHKKDGVHASWLATKHATAWDSLSAEDQKNEALAPYYITGTTAKDVLLTGVQCESCHGPGADYKKKSVMQDREAAIAGGMIIPDSTSCLKCHNEKAPGVLGTTAKDFDYGKMKLTGIHADMKKPEGK